MKATHLSAAALATSLTVLLAAHPARADEPEPCAGEACADAPQRARFSSTAPPPVIAASACSLHAALTIDDRSRRVDLQVDGRRCSTTPAPEDAIQVNVHIENGESQQHVVVEAVAPSGVAADVIRPVVVALGRELRSRIERAMVPPAPQPPPAPSRLPAVTYVPNEPTRLRYDPTGDEKNLKVYSPTMIGFGVASIVVGGLMMFGGTLGAFSSTGSYNNSGVASGFEWILVGTALTAGMGIPLVLVGKHKVPRVTASVSPTGGSLRVAF